VWRGNLILNLGCRVKLRSTRNDHKTFLKPIKNIMLEFPPFYQGLSIGLGLIIAIGAQNSFVLKQGLLKNQVFIIALTCSFIDLMFISLGILGLGPLITSDPILLSLVIYSGGAFLIYYGIKSFRNAFKDEILYVSKNNSKITMSKAFVTTLAVSLLNPHLYLDTCVLIGSIGAKFQGDDRFYFAAGAISSSFIWFFTMSYGARFLLPIFQKPISWKILDFIIGVIMFGIAISLMLWDVKNVSAI